MVQSKEGPAGSIVIDDRYSPLIVTSFIGEVELALGLWYEQAIQHVIFEETLEGRRIVNIHDSSRSAGSSPEMRKFWAEMSARNGATMEARVLANVIVVTNPLMRGVITAVGWLNPRVAQLKVFSSLAVAIEESLGMLARAGTPVTLPSEGYRLPPAVAPRTGT